MKTSMCRRCCNKICGCLCCKKIPLYTSINFTNINGPYYNPMRVGSAAPDIDMIDTGVFANLTSDTIIPTDVYDICVNDVDTSEIFYSDTLSSSIAFNAYGIRYRITGDCFYKYQMYNASTELNTNLNITGYFQGNNDFDDDWVLSGTIKYYFAIIKNPVVRKIQFDPIGFNPSTETTIYTYPEDGCYFINYMTLTSTIHSRIQTIFSTIPYQELKELYTNMTFFNPIKIDDKECCLLSNLSILDSNEDSLSVVYLAGTFLGDLLISDNPSSIYNTYTSYGKKTDIGLTTMDLNFENICEE